MNYFCDCSFIDVFLSAIRLIPQNYNIKAKKRRSNQAQNFSSPVQMIFFPQGGRLAHFRVDAA